MISGDAQRDPGGPTKRALGHSLIFRKPSQDVLQNLVVFGDPTSMSRCLGASCLSGGRGGQGKGRENLGTLEWSLGGELGF